MMRERISGSAAKERRERVLRRAQVAGSVLGILLLAGCEQDIGNDDAKSSQASTRNAGTGAAVGGQPAAGRGGAAAPAAPVLPPPPVIIPCGTAMCVSAPAGFGFSTVCCADEGTSTCGTTSASGSCMKPQAGDPRCPALNFRGVPSVPSCCTDKGACGLDGTMYGAPGCTDLATAAAQAAPLWFFGVSLPEPRPCDPTRAAHVDAGVDDAGT
jgi:hypothetical protein